MTLGEIYDAMPEEERKRWFFFLFRIVEFYGDGDTWFATSLIHDPPSGLINGDYRMCPDLNRRAPGGRARIALAWLVSAFSKINSATPEPGPAAGDASRGGGTE